MTAEKRDTDAPVRLHVGGLARGVQPQDLAALIARALPNGTTPTAEIMRDASTGIERGFGYVNVPGGEGIKAGAERAIAAYNGTRWRGKRMSVGFAKGDYLERLRVEWAEAAEVKVKLAKDAAAAVTTATDHAAYKPRPVLRLRRRAGERILLVDPTPIPWSKPTTATNTSGSSRHPSPTAAAKKRSREDEGKDSSSSGQGEQTKGEAGQQGEEPLFHRRKRGVLGCKRRVVFPGREATCSTRCRELWRKHLQERKAEASAARLRSVERLVSGRRRKADRRDEEREEAMSRGRSGAGDDNTDVVDVLDEGGNDDDDDDEQEEDAAEYLPFEDAAADLEPEEPPPPEGIEFVWDDDDDEGECEDNTPQKMGSAQDLDLGLDVNLSAGNKKDKEQKNKEVSGENGRDLSKVEAAAEGAAAVKGLWRNGDNDHANDHDSDNDSDHNGDDERERENNQKDYEGHGRETADDDRYDSEKDEEMLRQKEKYGERKMAHKHPRVKDQEEETLVRHVEKPAVGLSKDKTRSATTAAQGKRGRGSGGCENYPGVDLDERLAELLSDGSEDELDSNGAAYDYELETAKKASAAGAGGANGADGSSGDGVGTIGTIGNETIEGMKERLQRETERSLNVLAQLFGGTSSANKPAADGASANGEEGSAGMTLSKFDPSQGPTDRDGDEDSEKNITVEKQPDQQQEEQWEGPTEGDVEVVASVARKKPATKVGGKRSEQCSKERVEGQEQGLQDSMKITKSSGRADGGGGEQQQQQQQQQPNTERFVAHMPTLTDIFKVEDKASTKKNQREKEKDKGFRVASLFSAAGSPNVVSSSGGDNDNNNSAERTQQLQNLTTARGATTGLFSFSFGGVDDVRAEAGNGDRGGVLVSGVGDQDEQGNQDTLSPSAAAAVGVAPEPASSSLATNGNKHDHSVLGYTAMMGGNQLTQVQEKMLSSEKATAVVGGTVLESEAIVMSTTATAASATNAASASIVSLWRPLDEVVTLAARFVRAGSKEDVETAWLKDRRALTHDFKRKHKDAVKGRRGVGASAAASGRRPGGASSRGGGSGGSTKRTGRR